MPSWWGWQTADVRDRATAHLPALLYERLDEIGIDFTILYPSMALGYFEVDRRGAVVGALPRREHGPGALFAPYRDRMHRRRADPDEHARARRSPRPSTRSASSASSRC